MPSRNTPARTAGSTARSARALPVTTYAVLGQLAAGPSSGYEIKARLEAGAAHFWHASYSQIYAELRRLTDLALVSEKHVRQDARPDKRVYTITPAGRMALRAWLGPPLTTAALGKWTCAKGFAIRRAFSWLGPSSGMTVRASAVRNRRCG